jgi:electron transfer flavoprotein beta subunit
MKQVPDTTARKELGADFTLDRASVESVVNPFDEYAIEAALQLKERDGGEVIILTMGPTSAEDTVRKTLAMGADRAVLVTDPALHGTDWLGTCTVLAAALRTLQFDLVLTGTESTDARMGLVPAGLAEMLDAPLVTLVRDIATSGSGVTATRQISGGSEEVEATVPAVMSVVKGANEPRYPSLKGIMAAKRKEIAMLSLADLGIDAGEVGLGGARTSVTAATARADRQAGQVVKPDSPEAAATTIADFLQQHKFI